MVKKILSSANCRNCKARYDTSFMAPGTPFSCRHCGEVVRAPGKRSDVLATDAGQRLGQIAVNRGFITSRQLETALETQNSASYEDRRRLGDILVDSGVMGPRQVAEILRIQATKIAHDIPGYEVVEKLGEGGMGAVYKGVHLVSNKTVAMKVLAPRLLVRPEFVERFHREARVAIDLDHPNIVKGFDEGMAGELHYFVMEYVHGKSVGRVLKKRGAFGERRAMDIARQVTRALEYANARGIVHRDVKPDNIMITPDGKVKLADYGLVKYMDSAETANLTTEGQVMGTPNYISPEQAKGWGNIDIRSDIYSLGATLYHMVTGRLPYDGPSAAVVLGMHISSAPPDPRDANPEASREASQIILQMMAKDTARRFQNPSDLLRAMETYFSSKPTKAHTKTNESSGFIDKAQSAWDLLAGPPQLDDTDILETVGEDHKELSRSAPLLLAAGIILLLSLVVTIIMMFGGNTRHPDHEGSENGDEAVHAEPDSDDDISDNPLEDVSVLDVSDPDVPGDLPLSEEEMKAKELFQQALMETGAKQMELLKKVNRLYGKTDAAVLARKHLEVASEEERKRRQEEIDRKRDEAKVKKEELEKLAIDAYQKTKPFELKGAKEYRAVLEGVIKRYKNTRGAELAAADLRRYNGKLAWDRQQKIKEQEQLRREKEEAERRRQIEEEGLPRARFISAYVKALSFFELKKAGKYAKSLSSDTRYPGLNKLGEDCYEDAKDLSRFYPSVSKGLTAAGKEEQRLAFTTGLEFKGVVGSVRDGIIYSVVNDTVPMQMPITSLSHEMAVSFFLDNYKESAPDPSLVLGLYYFAHGDRKKAGEFFDSSAKKDPRRKHHLDMLTWE